MRIIKIAALAALAILPTQAAWVDWTTITPTNQVNGIFQGGTGAYAGTIVATRSNVNAGLSPTSPGLAPNSITSALITPTFASLYPLNLGGIWPLLGAAYDDTNESFDGEINFTGLANGFLPNGTLFSLFDIDSREDLLNLTAYDAGGIQIATPWLFQRPGILGFLDANLLDGVDNTASFGAVVSTLNAGVYNFNGPDQNDSGAALMFFTTADISRLTYSTQHRLPGFNGGGGYNFAFAADAVPEPSTYAMFSLGLLGAAYLQRRNSSS
jgi:hypothetical protein